MVGGMTSMIGLALSSLAPNLTMLFFTYGGITGKQSATLNDFMRLLMVAPSFAAFGLCLNYTSWIVAISDSFNKKHAVAFSLSQSGVGLGIFVFGPLFSFLISIFGWRGALLITGACTFQLTCLGALIFPPRNAKEITNLESFPLTGEQKCTDEEMKMILNTLNKEVSVFSDNPTIVPLKWMTHCSWMLHLSCFFWSVATSIPYILLADYAHSLDLVEYVLVRTVFMILTLKYYIVLFFL